MTRKRRGVLVGSLAILAASIIFLFPFLFIFLQASKNREEAQEFSLTFPAQFQLWENVLEVFEARDYMLIRAFINSTILTVGSVTIMIICAALVGYVLQRRVSRINPLVNLAVMAGLIIPPAVVPTIWVLQKVGLFKTMPGMILIEVALGMSFCILLYRAFISTIPRSLDEAAIIDGAGPIRLFFQVVFPLLRGVTITVIVVQSVAVFNDFTGPLYFLPGDDNATVQLTLYNFQSQYQTQWNLLFANILLITIPPLIMFIFFNKRIVEGMTAGAVKG